MAKKNIETPIKFSKWTIVIIAVAVVIVSWLFAWGSKNTIESDKSYAREISEETSKYVAPQSKISFEYPSNYTIQESLGWNLTIDKNDTKGETVGAGTNIYVNLGDFEDFSGCNPSNDQILVYSRTIKIKSGYMAIQYINVNEPAHAQGEGTVYTGITNGERSACIYTFIGATFDNLEKRIRKNIQDTYLSEEDVNDILDNRIKAYDQVIKSFRFL
jgi:hypothetical protein